MSNLAPMVWSLDISKTRSGFVVGRAGETPRALSIVCKGMETPDAASKLFFALNDRWSIDRPNFLFYEAPLGAGIYQKKKINEKTGEEEAFSRAHTAMTLMAMTTAVTVFADAARVPRRAVNVQSARKSFLGRPRFDHQDDGKRYAKAMCELLQWPCKNLDEADAFAVWYHGCYQVATKYVVPILPSMQAKVAAQFAGALAERDDSLLKRTFG